MPVKIIIPALLMVSLAATGATLGGFTRSPFFHEQVRLEKTVEGIRMLTNLPQVMHADRPTLVIFFATPNGNTIEQTMGCAMVPDLDWHFDIQHIAAQTRVLRDLDRTCNIVLVCMEAEGLSWPTWRSKHDQAIIRETLERILKEMPGTQVSGVVTGHSGGGSLITGFINSYDAIPEWCERVAYLDANYSYSDGEKHGDKLLAWLNGDDKRRLVVVAYDDREITYDGKKVVGPTGGTYRASHRMIDRLAKDLLVKQGRLAPFDTYAFMDGQISFFIHPNPANKILHTALVGDMNGFLEAITLGTPLESKWGTFGGPRAYTKWIQPAQISMVNIPTRRKSARGGTAVMHSVLEMPLIEREATLLKEFKQGNLPEFLRQFVTIKVKAKDANNRERAVVFQVMPDYLSVGSDADFVRTPLTPMAAQKVADAFDCSLPTRKIVNDISAQATVRLGPKPLGEPRTTVETFIAHNSIVEEQRKGNPLGKLVAGIKKDVVITNLSLDRTDHVAIYGWHQLDGKPIQPLTTVHVNWYVDYSHGIRLVKRAMIIDGQPKDIREVLADPMLHPLLSDEGPIAEPHYRLEAHKR
ncbi:MAG: hypothetical protein KBC96_12535 [Armatimonadetes bacterium]|nr:hypothetical protein [Armatimonadota bacterium]